MTAPTRRSPPETDALIPEQALAEALHDCGEAYDDCNVREDQDDLDAGLSLVRVYRDCDPSKHMTKARAILATEPMQAIARLAAIGAAVEGLGDDFTIHARSVSRYGKAVHIEIVNKRPPVVRGNLTDALAAIAAATEEDEK